VKYYKFFSFLFVLMIHPLSLPAFGQTWTSIGPPAGEVYNLFFSPHNPDHVFAYGHLRNDMGDGFDLMFSNDGGASFTYVRSLGEVYSMAFHPTSPDTAWLLTEDAFSISSDGGFTWSDREVPGPENDMEYMVRAPTTDGSLYMLSRRFDARLLIGSQDGGNSWETIYEYSEGNLRLSGLYFRPGIGDTLYTVERITRYDPGTSSVWRSADGGTSWTCLADNHIPPFDYDLSSDLQFHPDDQTLVFTEGTALEGNYGLVSHNGGATFDLLTGPWGGSEHIRPFVMASGEVLVITGEDIYLSDDLGISWSNHLINPDIYPVQLYYHAHYYNIKSTPYNPDRFYLLGGSVGYHQSLDQGASWDATITGFSGATVHSIETCEADDDVVLATTRSGNFITADRGVNWKYLSPFGGGYSVQVSQSDPNTIVKHRSSTIHLSRNAGDTWEELSDIDSPGVFAFHPSDPNIMLCMSEPGHPLFGLYRTEDGGNSWVWTDSLYYVDRFWWDPLDENRVFVREVLTFHSVSHDGGNSFQQYSPTEFAIGFDLQPDGLGAVASGANDDGSVVVHCPDRSTLDFTNQVIIPDPLYDIAYGPNNTFVGLCLEPPGGQIIVSVDHGSTWSQILDLEYIFHFQNIVRISSDGTIFVAGDERGVLMSTDALDVADDLSSAIVLQQFTLLPVYPNPFNGTAVISFDLPRPEVVTVTVFDALGRTVSVLTDHQAFNPGRNTLVWNADRVASGMYFILATGEGLLPVSQRMTLVK
jgi:photosystem II stability/assembly factor-like uncharacterized protein